MKPAKIAVICIAAVSAIGLALVVRAMGSSSREPAAPAAASAPEPARPMARVLVAARDLDPGARLAAADLTWKDWPVDELHPALILEAPPPAADAPAQGQPEGAVARVTRRAVDAVSPGARSDYVGAVVRERILAGEPILERKVVLAGDSGYLAAYLEPGMRAMAIRVTVETAAGGFILPGDRVDVVLTREVQVPAGATPADRARFTSATVMRNIKVLAIDQATRVGDDAQAVVGATATLELSPRDAEVLALAKSEGELSLILRSYADTAGPSGRVAAPAPAAPRSHVVRVYRGGEPQEVTTP